MVGIQTRTQEKIEWIKKQKEPSQSQVRDKFIKKFNSNWRTFYNLMKFIKKGKYREYNKREWEMKLNTDGCYFCKKSKRLNQHHILYKPELVVTLCCSCHNKIHYLQKCANRVPKSVSNKEEK